jgi:hypothetical protein
MDACCAHEGGEALEIVRRLQSSAIDGSTPCHPSSVATASFAADPSPARKRDAGCPSKINAVFQKRERDQIPALHDARAWRHLLDLFRIGRVFGRLQLPVDAGVGDVD